MINYLFGQLLILLDICILHACINMAVNIQAVGQTYNQISEERTGKQEQTEYKYEKNEQSIYVRKKTDDMQDKQKIRELYVQTTEHIFGRKLSNDFFELFHTRVQKPNYYRLTRENQTIRGYPWKRISN